jgi:hypothetical protein
VRVLDDIFRRMDAHQSKKSAMLRALHLATDFAGLDVGGEHAAPSSQEVGTLPAQEPAWRTDS